MTEATMSLTESAPVRTDPLWPGGRPAERLVRLSKALGCLFGAERRLRARDQRGARPMTYTQVRALMMLLEEREATPSALARAADLNPASVTALIDHLEKEGVVARRRDPHDRRVSRISLTELGRERTVARRRDWYEMIMSAVADCSPAEIEAACAVLARVAAAIDSFSPSSTV
jgi:DNA-binding MarR family transcriptional regulator